MRQREKKRQVRRRLMTGVFCISLLFADLTSVIPVWAQETVVAEPSQGSGESESDETMIPEDENQEETVQNPDENISREDGESQPQTPDEENAGDNAQNPDEGDAGDDAQNPDEEGEGNNTQNPEEEEDVTDDASEEPDLSEEEETADTEETDSVSENDMEEQGEVRALAASGADIASGTYGDITWVIDADGKLTVEGTGDFASSYSTGYNRVPWYSKRSSVKSAKIKVSGMTDASYMFYGCYNMTDVTFEGSDTSTVKNMAHMFDGCFNRDLSIDLSDLRTDAVTNMSNMFSGCSRITDLDIGRFDTRNITDMSYMFSGCYTLESIDFGQNFNTRNVTDMSGMFSGCKALKSVDVSGFNTANVTNMSNLFNECRNMGDLNLSGWNTTKVTDMSYMFVNCGFHRITLGGSFTTHNVTNMSHMFACNSDPKNASYLDNQDRWDLKGFDLGWLDLSSVETMRGIFSNCNVKQMDFSRLNTEVTSTLEGLFQSCDLTGMDFSKLRTDTITDMSYMFWNCKGNINLHTLNTDHVKNMSWMFATWNGMVGAGYHPGINRLASLDLSGLNMENVTDMSCMFRDQRELTNLNVAALNTANVTNMYGMFYECEGLTSIDLSSLDCGNVTQMSDMFCFCISLKDLKLGNLGAGELTMSVDEAEGSKYNPTSGMFQGCKSLESIDLSRFNFENLTGASMIFDVCDKLTTIYTPYNVKYNQSLPAGDWYMADGTKLEDNCLPKNLTYSVLIQKGSKPAVSAARMEVSKKKTVYGCGETIGTDDLTVTYYGTDGSVRKLTGEEYTTNAASLNTNEPGTLELVITCNKDGKTLTGKITLTVAHILSADNTAIILPSKADYDYTYDGQPKMPKPVTVTYTKKNGDGTETPVMLTEGTDYTVSYRNNINAYEEPVEDGAGDGTDTATAAADSTAAAPTVIIKGTGSYSGTATQTFSIKKAQAPVAEEKTAVASQCTQARPNRTIDLSDSFADFGKKTGYEIINVEDTKNIFSRTPETTDIKNGVLTYGTNAAQEDDTASITVKVSFDNYEDAVLTVKIVMGSKNGVTISGITVPKDITYTGTPAAYGGAAFVTAEDGTDVTDKVTLVYSYSGTMADKTPYPAQNGAAGTGSQTTEKAPVNAGSYVLTVAVKEDNPDYTGSIEYPFTISPAAVTVKAGDIVDLMQGNQEASKPTESYQSEFRYDTEGLLNGDSLKKEPEYTITDMKGQAVAQIDMSKAGTYYIVPYGADAGMNYAITYINGILTVSEERVVYTVRFDCMGHGSSFVKSGIKAGSLLELSEEERKPVAEGYLFAGWYQDKTFVSKSAWNFDTDTVQADLTLYACWLTGAAADSSGLQLYVQEIPDMTYTGSAQKPAVTVYDSDGTTVLKAGKDYTIKYVNNTNAVTIGENGEPEQAGGIAKVENPGKPNEKTANVIGTFSKDCPYVVITGKGNYTETIYRNFRILPADIAADGAETLDNTPLAAGFTLKYTDQFEAKANKTAKIISSLKYKKALKEGSDYEINVLKKETDGTDAPVTLTQGKLPLNAGNYELVITGKGNYAGTLRRSLYVADKKNLMKNATITYAKTIQADGAEDLKKGIEQSNVTVKISGQMVDAAGYTIDYAGTNHAVGTATMTIMGTNGYVGSKSVTFKITGRAFSAKTVEVKADDGSIQDGSGFKAVMTYTGRALTQNKVTLTAKADNTNPTARELIYGDDYTIAYKNNVKKGTATMTFTANPRSGFSGSFKKTFKINTQNLSEDMFVEKPSGDAVYSAGGAALDFQLKNAEGIALKQGTDYTVSYKNNKAATKERAGSSVKAGSKQPVMTIKGKGNYAGTLAVEFQIIPAAIDSAQVTVTAAQVQKKSGMKLKDFKIKVTDGKAGLKAGKDYTIDESGCTPEIIQAYADSLGGQGATGTAGSGSEMPKEPKVVIKGMGNYGMQGDGVSGTTNGTVREISLADYIYTTKLTAKNLKVEVTGSTTYTGQNVEPTVKVSYYKDNDAAKQGASGKELTQGTDYKVTYGSKNIPAGKKKGSITITGAGIYGGSVTVKFDIEKKQIY